MALDLRVPMGPLLEAFGVPITVSRTVIDEAPIATTGIWVAPITDDMPFGGDFQRREVRRVMAVSRSGVPTLPRGSIVMAPEILGGTILRWRVDGTERVEADHARVVLVPDFDLEP